MDKNQLGVPSAMGTPQRSSRGQPQTLGVPSFPALGSQQRLSAGQPQASARVKIALKQGRSLMDWIRLGNSGRDLSGVGGRKLAVTPDELAKHNTEKDCWMAINGKVYNVTEYMEYHPGGVEELMRGAGREATQLFNEVHRWVNYESMLAKCLVGKLKANIMTGSSPRNRGLLKVKEASDFAMPLVPVTKKDSVVKPRYDWFQTDGTVTLSIYTKCTSQSLTVIVDNCDNNLFITIFIKDYVYTISVDLENDVSQDYQVKKYDSGKIDVVLQKTPPKKWGCLGTMLDENDSFVKRADKDPHFRECTLRSINKVTHDTNTYELELPKGTQMSIPIGHHVHLKVDVQGMEITRSYTCVTLPAKDDQDFSKKIYLMIKIYPNGTLTPVIGRMSIGNTIYVSDPDGTFDTSRLKEAHRLVMLAAGTGFTPMVRLLWNYSRPDIEKKLLFFNKSISDVLWKDVVDQMVKVQNKCSVIHILSKPDHTWTGATGRISESLLREHIPERDTRKLCYFCVCGPTAFTEEANRLLRLMGYASDDIHLFEGESASLMESRL